MNLYLKSVVLFVCLFANTTCLWSQNAGKSAVEGIVNSTTGESLVGVNVIVKGANKGTVTDIKGQFFIKNLPSGVYTLVFSYVGYHSQEKVVTVEPDNILKVGVQLEEETLQMNGVEIVGKSMVSEVKALPYAVAAVPVKNLYNSATDAKEVLNRVPGVRIQQEGGVGSNYNFTLNGFSGNQVKFFMDGIPMDNFGSSLNLNNIPVNMIDRIEVYKGVVPVWLGTDALGGAVNIITNKKNNFLDASYTYGSFNTHLASINAATTNKETGLTFRANTFYNYSDNDYKVDVPITDLNGNILYNDEVRRFHDRYKSGTIKVEGGFVARKFADNLLLGMIYTENNKQVQNGVTMTVPYGQLVKKGHSYIPSLKYSKQDLFVHGLDVSLNAAYSLAEESQVDTLGYAYNWKGDIVSDTTDNNSKAIRTTDLTYKDKEFTTQLNTGYAIGENSAVALNYAYSNFTRSAFDKEHPDDPGNLYDKSLVKQHVGLSLKRNFGKKINVTGFVKYYHLNAETSKEVDFALPTQRVEKVSKKTNSVGYGLASNYFLNTDLQLKFSYEHAYRLPVPGEIFGVPPFVLSNPDLGPEQSDNINVGALYTGRLSDKNSLMVELNGVYRGTEDLIYAVVNSGGATMQYQNLGKARTLGVEGSATYNWRNKLHAGINVTYQNIVDKTDKIYNESYNGPGMVKNYHKGFKVPNMPYFFGNLNLGADFKNVLADKTNLSVNYYFNFVEEFYLTFTELGANNDDFIIPRQTSHNIEVSYSLKNGKYNITGECKNLFDSALYDKYYLQKPGRAFYIKLRYTL